MRMYMKTDDGRFVKTQLEEFVNKETEMLWILVDSEEEATHDPACIQGNDLTVQMLMFLKDHFGVATLSCYTPEEDKVEKLPEDRYATAKAVKKAQAVAVLGSTMMVADEHILTCGDLMTAHVKNMAKRLFAEPICDRLPIQNGLPRERFSHRRPELSYGKKFQQRPRGRIR